MQAPLFKATLVAVAILVLAIPGQARITRVVVEHTETLGRDGYQKLTGHAYGELDPKLPLNAIITDLEFAPRNARRMVEYVATFTMIKPADMAKASGVLLSAAPMQTGASLAMSSAKPPVAEKSTSGFRRPSSIRATIAWRSR
jgi:hypothetical protein